MKIRTSKIEDEWTTHQFEAKYNNDYKKKWRKFGIKNYTGEKIDHLTFADDANIDIKNKEHILIKLKSYGKSTIEYELETNWSKVNILTSNKNDTNLFIEEPYNKIKYVRKCKILGHMMTADSKMNEAVDDRLNKAKGAWEMMNKKLLVNKSIKPNIKIRLFNALILRILLYGLQILPLKTKQLDKMQSFYSKCIRYIVNESYDHKNPHVKLKTNQEINKIHNLSTIQSLLVKLRYKLYIGWKTTYPLHI